MAEEHGTDHCTAGLSAERIARNDAIFQHANEAISEVVEVRRSNGCPSSVSALTLPALKIVQMLMKEYRAIREDPRTFLNVPGHEASAQGWAQVIESHDG